MTISPINSFSYFSTPLRALQLVFAILVTCITSDAIGNAHGKAPGRMVYTLVVAVFSIVMASILLTPFTSTLTLFPLDFLFFILWTMSLKLSPDWISLICEYRGRECQYWTATLISIFCNVIFWLLSTLITSWVVYCRRGTGRRWYRSNS